MRRTAAVRSPLPARLVTDAGMAAPDDPSFTTSPPSSFPDPADKERVVLPPSRWSTPTFAARGKHERV